MPTGLDLGYAEAAVTLLARLFGASPFQQIVRRAADTCSRGKRAEAMFAALLLIMEGPAHGEEREDDEEENLQEIGSARQWDVERSREADAEQKHEQKRKRCLQSGEQQVVDPTQRVRDGVELNVAEAGDC